ncbi:MAG TPA: hypothetical protein VG734_20325 [Lacunisphaera sp.]|nr:hypothetical protein [Lacunisphaera sp.]
MTTTLREFQRNFSRMQRAAESGQDITVRGRSGKLFVFKALKTSVNVGERMAHLAGSVKTGRRVKSLAGYGRR